MINPVRNFLLIGMLGPVLVMANGSSTPIATTLPVVQAPIIRDERLSEWLLRNVALDADTTSLHWQVQSERAEQWRLQQSIVQTMPPDLLSERIRSLPITGRLTLINHNARVLQANPAQDPVLGDGHSVVLYTRPRFVSILNTDSSVCLVPHHPMATSLDYVQHCRGVIQAEAVDWVWLAQSDGRASRVGVAPWNIHPQDQPAPGAWIWAPDRSADVDPAWSDNLIRFLATQIPAEHLWQDIQPKSALQLYKPPEQISRPQYTASDWGEIGLLQTPTARMAPAGSMRFHVSQVEPYTRGTVMFQPLDWFEAGFRYTDVANRLYGGADFSGDQSLKDKSIDFKVRLLEEGAYVPQLAVGLRDAGGTGLFSSEYLVANKRWGNWDASVGLAWGNMGARGHIKNPLSALDAEYATRPGSQSEVGGTANTQSFFRGPAALFGGVQWQTPWSSLIAKVEIDGNTYQNEPQSNNQVNNSPINVGLTYRLSPRVDLSMAFERGDKWMWGITLHEQLNTLKSAKVLDPPLPKVRDVSAMSTTATNWNTVVDSVQLHTGWNVRMIQHQRSSLVLTADVDKALFLQERIDRAVTILNDLAPYECQKFVLHVQERGLPMTRIEIDRTEWVAQRTQPVAPSMRLPVQQVTPITDVAVANADWQSNSNSFKPDFSPSFSYVLGGPDSFFLYQAGVQATMEARLGNSTWFNTNVNYRLFDNYDLFKFGGFSDLPRVRTQVRDYVTTSRLTLPNLQVTNIQKLNDSHYVSAYAGLLEQMFGGVGAEWFYRPWQSPLAVGVDVSHVRQRGFKQDFEFKDYSTNTGHVTMYWDTGWNGLNVNLSFGKYLAGDVGSTLDIRREFSNGVSMGAWATKTNVSEQQFGEGGFDKGIYVFIPFDVMLPISTSSNSMVVWKPITRDGGAKLSRRNSLYDFTTQRDRRALTWGSVKDEVPQSAEDRTYILKATPRNALQRLGETTSMLSEQIADVPASTWWLTGGTILASSLLDREMDKRLSRTPAADGTYSKSASSNIPLYMALGTGLMYTGITGEGLSKTAESSLTAAAYTLGANLATRYVVGRSRPIDNQGSGGFHGFTSNSVNSGFTSNHVAIAFALATPYAQQYDMPWLYGAAALTAVGRMQQREHWMSDTVAGAFMGYAMGSFMSEQQNGRKKKGVRLNATPQSVSATWAF